MRYAIQKHFQILRLTIAALGVLTIPLAINGTALAYAKGTCFVLVQGQSEKIGPCQKVAKGVIPAAQLKKLDPKKCYSITAGESDQGVAETDCSGKGQAGTEVTLPATSCSNNTQDEALCAPKCQDSNDCNLTKTYINPFINKFLAPLAILAVIIGIIWGGIEFSTAGGDPKKVAAAKGKIEKALIGLVAFLFLWAFLEWLIPGGLI